eukprot:COSAG02_NODE_1491_length_12358_cov_52.348014_4_plen_214_part_00
MHMHFYLPRGIWHLLGRLKSQSLTPQSTLTRYRSSAPGASILPAFNFPSCSNVRTVRRGTGRLRGCRGSHRLGQNATHRCHQNNTSFNTNPRKSPSDWRWPGGPLNFSVGSLYPKRIQPSLREEEGSGGGGGGGGGGSFDSRQSVLPAGRAAAATALAAALAAAAAVGAFPTVCDCRAGWVRAGCRDARFAAFVLFFFSGCVGLRGSSWRIWS